MDGMGPVYDLSEGVPEDVVLRLKPDQRNQSISATPAPLGAVGGQDTAIPSVILLGEESK